MQSQTKDEMIAILEKHHQILQKKNIIAAPGKSNFFFNKRKVSWTYYRKNTITRLKSLIDATQKLQPPTNKKKIQKLLGVLNFLGKDVYKIQLYLRSFDNILWQQNDFEWKTEHQTQTEETKKISPNIFQTQFQILINRFKQCAMLHFLAWEKHFLGKDVYKIQLYLRSFDNILWQQNDFEWKTEHQTQTEETKKISPNIFQTQFQILINRFMQCAMLHFLAWEKHFYNPTMERKKWILYQHFLAYLHKLN